MSAIQLLLVVVGAIAVTAFASRKGRQPALVVVVLASAISFIPGLPRFELAPELILSVVLPPLLYSAALDFSFVSFARNLRPILSLGIGLVVASTAVTGVVAAWAVPGLALVPALLLGAVVAPPDAVAALAVGRKLGLPKKVMAILTGESLVNDAAALTLFTLAVAAATGKDTLFGNPFLLFGYGVLAGVLIGLALALVVHWTRSRLRDSGLETALGLIVPFAAYLLAEEVHASGVLAVVAAGIALGHNDAKASFATRLQGRQVWRSLDVLLEAFVFAYMGLQCKFVFAALPATGISLSGFILGAAAVLAVVLLVRPVWVFLTYGHGVLRGRMTGRNWRRGRQTRLVPHQLPWQYMMVISWTGMRGVVTMAAAAGVPAGVPGRDLIQALAFVVAVGTLLIQGPTLPLLIRRLHLAAPEEERRAEWGAAKARDIVREAARDSLGTAPEGADPAVFGRLRDRFTTALAASRESDETRMTPAERELLLTVRQQMLAAQRTALVRARKAGELPDDIVRTELERLDLEEAAADAAR
ncbi:MULTISPECIES: sodium:proton antiporter [unclassified Crossiella]|uniref:cation:proton antiporter n=1 Tax=unclassified Crossiella TaxID=2620835 RepID=UPI00200027AA|nr:MULTISPECIES: sodium:proton antiporter [unclassified Crossiella]MCK2243549.1 sodium:proton antiporter [Crossiella sp. S99.2]MCK2257407.1 sodium:proton antiporter [Crossiella sp. S99.1]